jgi:hypothetical protein
MLTQTPPARDYIAAYASEYGPRAGERLTAAAEQLALDAGNETVTVLECRDAEVALLREVRQR